MIVRKSPAGTNTWLRAIRLAVLLLCLGTLFTSFSISAQTYQPQKAGQADFLLAVWQGVYTYEDLEGRNVSGFFMTVDHRLNIYGDPARPVVLTMQGYQTDTSMRCTITGDIKHAEVRFLSFGDGRIVNEAGHEQYKLNEVLFVLERPSKPHTGRFLLTKWMAYKPDGVHKRLGRYFHLVQPHTQPAVRK